MRHQRATVVAVVVTMALVLANVRTPQRVRALPAAQVAAPLCGGTLLADADATVRENDPNVNFGLESNLMVARGGRIGVAETLLHFPSPAALVPAGYALTSVEVEFAMASVEGSNPFAVTVAGLSGAWSQSQVTWSNRPAAVGAFATQSVYHAGDGDVSTARIDVTGLAGLWATGAVTETSVLLRPGAPATEAAFLSIEGAPDLAPRLIVHCKPASVPLALNQGPRDVAQAAGLNRLKAHSATPVTLRLDQGAVRVATLDLALPPEAGARGTQRARWFTQAYSDTLRLDDPAMRLQLTRSTLDGNHVFFRQTYKGIPVYGSEIGVHMFQGHVVGLTGDYLPNLSGDPSPALTAGQAEDVVLALLKDRDWMASNVCGGKLGSDTQLRYVNTGLTGGPDHTTHLAWQVNVKNAETFFIDTVTGQVLLEEPAAISYDFDIETGNHDGAMAWCGEWWFTNNDDHLCSEKGCNDDGWADGEAPTTAWNINNTYWWYRNTLGRRSYDGKDSLIQLYIHVGNPWAQAHYLRNGNCMEFGDDFARVDDIVAHEYTHGVVEHTANLVYANESGAMNESFADVFGELTEGEGTDWILGDGVYTGKTRNLQYPHLSYYPQPETYQGTHWWPAVANPTGDNDHGGVHYNSGVPSKAAYLMIEGGSFNGYTVQGIGHLKGALLLYQVMQSLSSSSQMLEMRDLMVGYAIYWAASASGTTLGINGFTRTNVCSVQNAYASVGLGSGDHDCDGIQDDLDPDMDNDGTPNSLDNCPAVQNVSQSNVDGDEWGDACDADDDGDGRDDAVDNCPLAADYWQLDWNGNGVGDVCDDYDEDGITDLPDNCYLSYNPDQANSDNAPGPGDACDDDDDDDGRLDYPVLEDNCRTVPNYYQQDGDHDGVGDACDLCPTVTSSDNEDTDGDGLANPCDTDDDGDCVLDVHDNCQFVVNPDQMDLDGNSLGIACDDAEQNTVFDVEYNTPYDAGLGQFSVPFPHGALGGDDLVLPFGYGEQVTVDMAAPFFAQVVDSDGKVMASTSPSGSGGLKQTLSFTPALFSVTGSGLPGGLAAGADSQGADAMGYWLQVYPDPAAELGRVYDVSITFSHVLPKGLYVPVLIR